MSNEPKRVEGVKLTDRYKQDKPVDTAYESFLIGKYLEIHKPSDSLTVRPSPTDCITRWPRALLALSSLCAVGDIKHGGLGDNRNKRGEAIDHHRYDEEYCYPKLGRHLAKHLSEQFIDEETGHPHVVAIAWHAIQALEAYYKKDYHNLDILTDYLVNLQKKATQNREESADV